MKKWIAAWVVVFLTGMMFFNNVDLGKEVYWMPYFIWDKGKDVITMLAFLAAFPRSKSLYLKLIPVLIFLLIRLLWEPLSNVIGLNINDQRAINFFFFLLLLVYILIFSNELKWPNSKQ